MAAEGGRRIRINPDPPLTPSGREKFSPPDRRPVHIYAYMLYRGSLADSLKVSLEDYPKSRVNSLEPVGRGEGRSGSSKQAR